MKIYAKIENFTILQVVDNEKLISFTIGDRIGERVTDKTFRVASDAIGWAYEFYEELVK